MRNEKVFDNMAWWFHRHGVKPDHFTFAQAPVYAAMIWVTLKIAQFPDNLRPRLAFMILQILVVILDGADGILARRTGSASRRGYLLDALFDILGIGITIWAVQFLYPQYATWAIILLIVNFLVYVQNEIQETKSVTYTRGPVTGGLVLGLWYPLLVFLGILLPLVLGLILMVTRVHWRRRLWNYYQFFTAGRRKEYKAVPRHERASLRDPAFGGPGPPASPRPPRLDPARSGASRRRD